MSEWLPVVTGLAFAAGTAAYCGRLAARTLPVLKHSLSDMRSIPKEERRSPSLPFITPSRFRTSSIIGMVDGAIRHDDGAYSRAWEVTTESTIFSNPQLADGRCDDLAVLLAVPKPPGTVLSFRLSNDADPGFEVLNHFDRIESVPRCHPTARRFHQSALEHELSLAKAGYYRRCALTAWVRVPIKHRNDGPLHTFIEGLRLDYEQAGLTGIWNSLKSGSVMSHFNGITKRLLDDELESLETSEKVFRSIERECPLRTRRLSARETFSILYLGHNLDARSVPNLDSSSFIDLRPHLCGETLESGGWYILHGRKTPVAMVTMFVPAHPRVTAGLLRPFFMSPALNFRFTLAFEFISRDPDQARRKLDRRINQIVRVSTKPDGSVVLKPEAKRAHDDLQAVRASLSEIGQSVIALRCYALVYGPPASTQAELVRSLELLEERCETVVSMFRRLSGADAAMEEPAALRELYERCLVGEARPDETGREIEEVADSLAAYVPTESSWLGSKRPHTILGTTSGHFLGLDLWDATVTGCPIVVSLGQPRSGKSVFSAVVVRDVLATCPGARVVVVDFRESFGPLVKLFGGRHLRFTPDEVDTINSWDYPDLDIGVPPDEPQIEFVIGDLLTLAGATGQAIKENILRMMVRKVYADMVPGNEVRRVSPEWPKTEPTLSHVLDRLDPRQSSNWDSELLRQQAEELFVALNNYRGHPWLDAPTSPKFAFSGTQQSPLDVYEFDSLDLFADDIKSVMGYRAAGRVLRTIGRLNQDGTRDKTLIIMEENWRIKNDFPAIHKAAAKCTRQGPKDNVATIFNTHAFEDLEDLHDIVKTAGVRIIFKQSGDFSKLTRDANLSDAAVEAIRSIHNIQGAHSEFVLAVGDGDDQKVEKCRLKLDPVMLWTLTNVPIEANARSRVQSLCPHLSLAGVIQLLAENYPRGLVHAGLHDLDPDLLRSLEG